MKRKMCVRRYMARKMWGGFVDSLKYLALALLGLVVFAGVAYLAETYPLVRGVLQLGILGFFVSMMLWGIVSSIVNLYREAKEACGYEQD